MAVQNNQSAGEKVLKVLCNAYSGEKIAVVASNYHEFIEKCKLKFHLFWMLKVIIDQSRHVYY